MRERTRDMFKALLRLFGGSSSPPTNTSGDDEPLPPVTISGPLLSGENTEGYSAMSFPYNRPAADWTWRISLQQVKVAGVHYRADAVRRFAREIDAAVSRGNEDFHFEIRLEREPDNPHDHNAIRVIGVTESRPEGVHLGYLPREIAKQLVGVDPIGAAATRYYESGNYTELIISLLERKPTKEERVAAVAHVDVSAIEIKPGAEPAHLVSLALALKRAGRHDDAAALLERVIDGYGVFHEVPLNYVWELVKLYKRRKDLEAELALLERHAANRIAFTKGEEAVLSRLEELRRAEG
jgi:hypothetical protein